MPDSSVLVPAISSWHQHHTLAREEIERRLESGESMVLAAHSLVETYSSLTRLPPGRRISPVVAIGLIQDLVDQGSVVSPLNDHDYAPFLSELARQGIAGGRVYDALIARNADLARVDELLTFNVRHFQGLTSHAAVRVPDGG